MKRKNDRLRLVRKDLEKLALEAESRLRVRQAFKDLDRLVNKYGEPIGKKLSKTVTAKQIYRFADIMIAAREKRKGQL